MTPLTKLWQFLLTTSLGLLVLGLLLSPAPLRRTLQDSTAAQLVLAQQSANLLMQSGARRLVDAATQVASDAALQSALSELARGQAEAPIVRRSARERLGKFNDALRLSFLWLVDSHGKVLARVAPESDPTGAEDDNVAAHEAVEDALRGYRLDDLWLRDGQLVRVAAAPLLSPERDRYVGAVVLGLRLTEELRQQLAGSLGVQVTLLSGDQVLAGPPAPREALVALRSGDGHPRALPGSSELGLLLPLPGEAARDNVALLLRRAPPSGLGLRAVLHAIPEALGDPQALRGILLPLSLGVFIALFIGLYIVYREADRPYQDLLRALSAGDLDGAQARLPRRLRPLLAALKAHEEVLRASQRSPEGTPVELSRSQEPLASTDLYPASAQLPPPAPPAPAPPRPAPTTAPMPPPQPAPPPSIRLAPPEEVQRAETQPLQPSPFARPDFAALLEPSGAMPIPADGPRTLHDALAPTLSAVDPTAPDTATIRDLPSNVVQAAIESALQASPASYRGPVPTGVLSLREGKGPLRVTPPGRATIHEETTAVGREDPEQDDLEQAFRRTYQEFLVTKQRCQESIEGITYEKFVSKLRNSRDQIMKQHNCRAVRFQVYVKDGKAALKAIPVTR